MQKNKVSLFRTLSIYSVALFSIFILSFVLITYLNEYNDYKSKSEILKKTNINKVKETLKWEVQHYIEFINNHRLDVIKHHNTMIKRRVQSSYHITNGSNNLCLGHKSGIHMFSECNNNICLGSDNGISGNNNIQIGNDSNLTGTNNIVLSINKNDTNKILNNKLLIDNNLDEENPFIFGDMNRNSLSLNTNKIKSDVVLNVNGSIYAETYNNFKGCYNIDIDYNENIECGMIIKMEEQGKLCSKEKDKSYIGIFINKSEVLKNGVLELNYLICSSGMCSIWISNINGECEIGDYICSSNISGIGMKQYDDIKRNYTIGKVIENIDWKNIDDVIEFNGILYKKKCIRCFLSA